ncbi:cell wall hydrolase [Alteraurantiacibacter aquimixticola]|uniref:Cell wall hydrolase n=2 Tax=Alteraurantiacibacter aquimixticola TaxID=2489173 RepID=A0A4T3F8K9_9SPHN|nr:cell wall hydrolase [Alteraurantiacibacter aquimixticola]
MPETVAPAANGETSGNALALISEPGPGAFKPLTAEEAIIANALVPVAETDFAPGMRLQLPDSSESFDAAAHCLTAAIYYEAGFEPADGQRAVAQVVINRVHHPAYPNSVCDVVFQGSERSTGCQFTFTCDGSLNRQPIPQAWDAAQDIARQALSGTVYEGVGLSTHYHADYVVPYWASSLAETATIGRHIFYRWNGREGTRISFAQAYRPEGQIPAGLAFADGVGDASGRVLLSARIIPEERPILNLAGAQMSGAPIASEEEATALGTQDRRPSTSERFVIPMTATSGGER